MLFAGNERQLTVKYNIKKYVFSTCSCFLNKVSLQLSFVADISIVQLDRKAVPQARCHGCKSSVTVNAVFAAPHKSERQLTSESAKSCRTRD